MKIINSGLIHPFMFGLFPIFFIFSNNFSEISVDSLLLPVTIIFGTISVLIFILAKISNNIQKTTLTISFLLFLFFSVWHVRQWLDGFVIFDFTLGQFIFLVPVYAILFVSGLFLIYKIKDLSKLTQIISIVSIVILISFLPNLVLDATLNYSDVENDFQTEIKFESLERPNIYYIVLDGYAGKDSLNHDFNFDNSEFLNYLKNLGFIIPEFNFSNYGDSTLSMTSTLNMNYVHNQQGFAPNNVMLVKYLFSNNLVMKTLQNNNYTTIYIDGGGPMRDIRNSNYGFCHSTDNGLINAIFEISMLQYIYQTFFEESWYERINCGFSELEKVQESINSPFFVYAHLRTPHDPYLFDAEGNFVQYEKKIYELDEKISDERYIYQLQFVNKKINAIITKIMSLEQKPIIIISSDHGWTQFYEVNPTSEELIQRRNNFEAFYLPNIDNYESYRQITPVNIFRTIFNDYFGTNLEILENKAYLVNFENKTNLDQKDITDIINSKNFVNLSDSP